MSEQRAEVSIAVIVATAVVLVALIGAASCVGCRRNQAEACKVTMQSGSESAKLLAQAPSGVCHGLSQ